MSEIIPGINDKDWSELQKKLELVKPFTTWVHIDLLDGKFAENTSFLDPSPFKPYSNSLFFEAHLMVEDPEQYIEPFAQAGFRRFIGHIEKMNDQASFVARGQLYGEVGLALDAPTAVDQIKVNLEDLDFLTVMTVKAGFSGQEFQKELLEKCRTIRSQTSLPIEIDGGVNQETIVLGNEAGVSRFVATSALFSSSDVEKAYLSLHSSVEKS